MIELARVTKDFGSLRAVHEVSFTVQRGEIIGLLGPNGSGKTTLMRILTGFFPPTSGSARVAGFDAAVQALELRRCIGYLPENVVLYPDMGVRGFLGFCAGLRRLRGADAARRIDAVLQTCGLIDVAGRLIGNLSKGYRQRVGLAQALLHEPQVLILDEPTVGLDPRQVIEMRALISALRGRTTVLLSTHVLPEVSLTCDRVVIIDGGRIVAEDNAATLAQQLQGAERTLLRVAGPPTSVRAALDAVDGVERVEAADADADAGALQPAGVHGFVVHSVGADVVRAALAAAVVQRGWELYEMRPLPLSMEELFVRLVGGKRRGAP
jgi:ABC-2 type transport system ATP-binding protein